ncbi:MAG: DnaD domain protein [Anaerolineales bacterium]|nr:DnaD domain protein [Anaerolineales bacterium]
MKGFSGFPDGRLKTLALPTLFFSELLPIIDNLPEFKVTLYTFWALYQKEGAIRYVSRRDYVDDAVLMNSFGKLQRAAEAVLDDALERAVARGTLLHVSVESSAGMEDLYFVNTERGRAAVEGIVRGEWRPSGDPANPVSLIIERPNLFVLYEQNIGPLTPMIADQLRDAEQEYPFDWVKEAIEIAVNNNARSWAYISKILERWNAKGKQDSSSGGDSVQDRRRYIDSKYGDLIQH